MRPNLRHQYFEVLQQARVVMKGARGLFAIRQTSRRYRKVTSWSRERLLRRTTSCSRPLGPLSRTVAALFVMPPFLRVNSGFLPWLAQRRPLREFLTAPTSSSTAVTDLSRCEKCNGLSRKTEIPLQRSADAR